MSWAYCLDCDGALSPPTFGELVVGYVECGCGERRGIDDWSRKNEIDEIIEELRKP